MKCNHCNRELTNEPVRFHEEKVYHDKFCYQDHINEQNEQNYPYLEDWVGMRELEPHLEDTKRSDVWVLIRSNIEHGIYDVFTVDSEQEAINCIRDPDYDRMGYDEISAVFHDGRELNVQTKITLS